MSICTTFYSSSEMLCIGIFYSFPTLLLLKHNLWVYQKGFVWFLWEFSRELQNWSKWNHKADQWRHSLLWQLCFFSSFPSLQFHKTAVFDNNSSVIFTYDSESFNVCAMMMLLPSVLPGDCVTVRWVTDETDVHSNQRGSVWGHDLPADHTSMAARGKGNQHYCSLHPSTHDSQHTWFPEKCFIF